MTADALKDSYPIVVPAFLAVWMAFGWGLKKGLFAWIRHLAKKTTSNLDDIIFGAAEFPALLIMAAAGFGLAYHALLPDAVLKQVTFLPATLKVIVIFAFILFLDRTLGGIVSDYASKHEFLRVAHGLIAGVLHLVFIGIGLLIIFDSLGISITPIIASLGIGSLAVALALQPTLENLFAGVQLVIDQPVRPGQFIRLESGEEGYVERVGWRSTWIRQLPNQMVIIPNHQLINSRVLNYHYPSKDTAILLDLGVHYTSDLAKVERVTIEVAESVMKTVAGGIPEFKPMVRYNKLDTSTINFTVIMRGAEVVDGALIRHEFIKALVARYNQDGIVIPYPIVALNSRQEKAVFSPS
jgi:small-conductance mechanosensitive channel